MACEVINCPENCEAALPEVLFNICNPEVHSGNIARIFVTNIGNPLSNWEDDTEWTARMALLAANPAKIWAWNVNAEKPEPETNVVEISRGRKINGQKTHTIPGEIDETNQTNYDALREYECGRQILFWYETLDGMLYGGNDGIIANLQINEVIPKSANEITMFPFVFDWKAKHHPCRTISVVPGTSINS